MAFGISPFFIIKKKMIFQELCIMSIIEYEEGSRNDQKTNDMIMDYVKEQGRLI